ncbi:MAG: hypothetical protein H0U70_07160 [Tatlockia sp.]|nr:hypothetical protein [Tatlockia sp.]
MSNNDIDKAFVSPIDKFLFEFDAKHPKSLSQFVEIKKHERIFFLRDNAIKKDNEGEIWGEF